MHADARSLLNTPARGTLPAMSAYLLTGTCFKKTQYKDTIHVEYSAYKKQKKNKY